MFSIILITLIGQAPNWEQMIQPGSDSVRACIRIRAVGDIMMGSTYPVQVLPESCQSIFDDVREILADADITIGNLEGTICDAGWTNKRRSRTTYAFRMPKNYVNVLKDAGFDLLGLANNHINDFGRYGMNTTMELLDMVGIGYSGPVGKIAYREVKGINVAYIAFGFSPNCYSILDVRQAQRQVAALKRAGYIVLVSFHGGSEGRRALRTKNIDEFLYGEPRGNVIEFAHSVIDSGADLVLGHGPHVPRAIELYKDRLIGYSLGNFCTYGYFNLDRECGLSLILEVELNNEGKFVIARMWPVYQKKPGIPVIDSLARTIGLIKTLSLQDFPHSYPQITEDGTIYSRWKD